MFRAAGGEKSKNKRTYFHPICCDTQQHFVTFHSLMTTGYDVRVFFQSFLSIVVNSTYCNARFKQENMGCCASTSDANTAEGKEDFQPSSPLENPRAGSTASARRSRSPLGRRRSPQKVRVADSGSTTKRDSGDNAFSDEEPTASDSVRSEGSANLTSSQRRSKILRPTNSAIHRRSGIASGMASRKLVTPGETEYESVAIENEEGRTVNVSTPISPSFVPTVESSVSRAELPRGSITYLNSPPVAAGLDDDLNNELQGREIGSPLQQPGRAIRQNVGSPLGSMMSSSSFMSSRTTATPFRCTPTVTRTESVVELHPFSRFVPRHQDTPYDRHYHGKYKRDKKVATVSSQILPPVIRREVIKQELQTGMCINGEGLAWPVLRRTKQRSTSPESGGAPPPYAANVCSDAIPPPDIEVDVVTLANIVEPTEFSRPVEERRKALNRILQWAIPEAEKRLDESPMDERDVAFIKQAANLGKELAREYEFRRIEIVFAQLEAIATDYIASLVSPRDFIIVVRCSLASDFEADYNSKKLSASRKDSRAGTQRSGSMASSLSSHRTSSTVSSSGSFRQNNPLESPSHPGNLNPSEMFAAEANRSVGTLNGSTGYGTLGGSAGRPLTVQNTNTLTGSPQQVSPGQMSPLGLRAGLTPPPTTQYLGIDLDFVDFLRERLTDDMRYCVWVATAIGEKLRKELNPSQASPDSTLNDPDAWYQENDDEGHEDETHHHFEASVKRFKESQTPTQRKF